MSSALGAMLKKSKSIYNDRWVEQSKSSFGNEPRPETVAQHRIYWDAIVRAVETSEFDELLKFSRDAGQFQARNGWDLSDAVKRTVEATNLIELALLESNEGEIPPLEIINEIAELRSMIVMAVAEGFQLERQTRDGRPGSNAKEQLRAALVRGKSRYTSLVLANGDEIGPLYEEGMRFHFVESGKLRLYNLLPNGRCITLSILSQNDVFLQWRAQSQGLSCLCAEAMEGSSVISVSEGDIVEVLRAQPEAAMDVITNFARRLTESQVLIEDLMNNSVNLRLYRTLLELSRQFGKPEGLAIVIDVPLTHQRLADMIGSNRVTVTRKIHELTDRRIIEPRKNSTIAILNSEALDILATGADG